MSLKNISFPLKNNFFFKKHFMLKKQESKSENDPNGLNVLVNKEYVCQVHLLLLHRG